MVTTPSHDPVEPGSRGGLVLSPAQLKSRRHRNVAIGLLVGLLVVVFYAVTIAKMGTGFMNRPM